MSNEDNSPSLKDEFTIQESAELSRRVFQELMRSTVNDTKLSQQSPEKIRKQIEELRLEIEDQEIQKMIAEKAPGFS